MPRKGYLGRKHFEPLTPRPSQAPWSRNSVAEEGRDPQTEFGHRVSGVDLVRGCYTTLGCGKAGERAGSTCH